MTVGLVLPAYEPDTGKLRSYVDALLDVLEPAVVRIELDAPGGSSLSFPEYDAVEVNVVGERRGKGLAITQGFESLDTNVLAFADADGSTPADSIADVVRAVDDADVAVGSRRHPESRIQTHQSVLRRKLGDAFAWGSRVLLPVTLSDYQCGAKALTRDAWHTARDFLYEPGFAWDVELVTVADARGLDIAEVPVEWEDDPRSTVDTRETVKELARTVISLRGRYASIADGTEHLSRTRLVER
ncbi:glycosyltransferase [Salarchaeum japonicum]|uniref:Glycosyltransferase n=1 Tax=Salarchaeum japonicum TaxID=555573 RepID=A0AAV3T321_9EURY|nr:glycosyltransferase [Salarchaeum japonicum]